MSQKISINYPETKCIKHNSHTKHPLQEVYKNTKFKCKVCKTEGQGPRYRCDPCNFNIHPTCGTCPESLLSFTHPQHMLFLNQSSFVSHHKCDLFRKTIHGMEYKCKECSYYMHPLCTQVPEFLTGHVMHPPHTIRLQSMESKKCDVCERSCKRWRYYCGVCDVHIHVRCLSSKNNGGDDGDDGGFGRFFGELVVGFVGGVGNGIGGS